MITLAAPAKRIMSLTYPTQKMSKSHPDPKSRILITDSHSTISKKINFALTDSVIGVTYDPVNRPGVSNLIEIAHHIDEGTTGSCEDLAHDMKDLSMRALKEKVVGIVEMNLREVRERYEGIMGDQRTLNEIEEDGGRKARANAETTMRLVREAVGL